MIAGIRVQARFESVAGVYICPLQRAIAFALWQQFSVVMTQEKYCREVGVGNCSPENDC